MKAYKGFEKGLVCRGYQFFSDRLNTTDKANCRENGFHCAENPLDCLFYYPNWEASEYWLVEASGDIDEDEIDSKISCTEMKLVRKLDKKSFVAECLKYIYAHNLNSKKNWIIEENEGEVADFPFIIVRGINPIGKGKKDTIIGFAKENSVGEITDISMIYIDGKEFFPNIFYKSNGEKAFSGGAKI